MNEVNALRPRVLVASARKLVAIGPWPDKVSQRVISVNARSFKRRSARLYDGLARAGSEALLFATVSLLLHGST